MDEIIKIEQSTVGGERIPTVDARDLHEFLCVGTALKDWLPRRIQEFGFVQDVDFVRSFLSVDQGGDGRRHFHLSLDMAKELSMVERNARGKEARRYFIECERRALAVASSQLPDFANPAVAARAWADEVERRMALEHKVEADAPKVKVYERLVDAEGSLCLRDAAKNLQIPPSKLTAWLQVNGWIYRRVGKAGWLAYQEKIQSGYLKHKVTPYLDEQSGESRVSEQVRITTKGLTKIASMFAVGCAPLKVSSTPSRSAAMQTH